MGHQGGEKNTKWEARVGPRQSPLPMCPVTLAGHSLPWGLRLLTCERGVKTITHLPQEPTQRHQSYRIPWRNQDGKVTMVKVMPSAPPQVLRGRKMRSERTPRSNELQEGTLAPDSTPKSNRNGLRLFCSFPA